MTLKDDGPSTRSTSCRSAMGKDCQATDDRWRRPDGEIWLATANVGRPCRPCTIEDLFVRAAPMTLDLANRYISMLEGLGQVTVTLESTGLAAVSRVRFAGLRPRQLGFVATFALREPLASKRVHKIEHYGARWFTHHVRVTDDGDLDDELGGWLQQAYDTVGRKA